MNKCLCFKALQRSRYNFSGLQGKITFFNVISGILPITSGKIIFKGQDVTRWKAYEMAGLGLSRTFQNIRLFPGLSVRDNLIIGRTAKIFRELLLIRALKQRGLTILLIEHQMRLVMGIAERMVVFDHGDKIADGDPKVVRCNPKVVEAYIGTEVDDCAEN